MVFLGQPHTGSTVLVIRVDPSDLGVISVVVPPDRVVRVGPSDVTNATDILNALSTDDLYVTKLEGAVLTVLPLSPRYTSPVLVEFSGRYLDVELDTVSILGPGGTDAM